jgi:crotonobetainyl-CoA:carnitine CoA-transferase CaiB-like acyl-CoA transferase
MLAPRSPHFRMPVKINSKIRDGTRMLEGLKVVEFATYIAAPGAGGIMADWGADVVKIEPPGGDPIRGFFATIGHASDINPVFELDNRGKKGVVLDITKPEGRAALVRLVRDADIFLTNVRPAALLRAKLDWETLKGENPRLIYCSVTGYGLRGPDANKPGFDVASFWSRSGVAGLTTPKGSEPFPIRTGMGDHVTSLSTVSAILAAVIERGRTGVGRLVETSLLRAGVYAVGSDMAIQLRFGRVASNRPRSDAINPLANFFMTRDGRWICLVPRQGSTDWPALAKAIGRPDLLEDERFIGAKARRANGPAFVAALDAAFAALDYADVARRLDAIDTVWSPVQRASEVADDPQAQAAGCFVHTPDGEGGVFRAPAAPARFPGVEDGPRGPAPALGQHTEDVLLSAGFSLAEIAAMKESGAAA